MDDNIITFRCDDDIWWSNYGIDGSRRAFVPFRAVDRPIVSLFNRSAMRLQRRFTLIFILLPPSRCAAPNASRECPTIVFSVLYTKYQLSVLENAHTACTRHIYIYVYIYIYMYIYMYIYICIWCIVFCI